MLAIRRRERRAFAKFPYTIYNVILAQSRTSERERQQIESKTGYVWRVYIIRD